MSIYTGKQATKQNKAKKQKEKERKMYKYCNTRTHMYSGQEVEAISNQN